MVGQASLRTSERRGRRTGSPRVPLLIAAALGAAGGLGAAYQAVRVARDLRDHVPAGALVEVGGRRRYISVAGEARPGRPTVVLDAGLGHVAAVWGLVQPGVAAFARVCAYDRAGYGWSDPGPAPRSSQRIVRELRALLAAAGVVPPYVLVGHSFGGLNMSLYAERHPEEVAGLVLVDALPKNIAIQDPANFRFFLSWNRLHYRLLEGLTRLGLVRLYLHLRGTGAGPSWVAKLPPGLRAGAVAELLRRTYATAADETAAMHPLMERARTPAAADAFPDIPLVVLAHGLPDLFTRRMSPRDVAQAERVWRAMQAELAALSPQGRLVVAEGAGHKIHLDRPDLVVEAIRAVLVDARFQALTDPAADADAAG